MVVGVMQVELHVPNAHSLKDRRSVVKSLREQLRGRFNIAVAELDPDEKWQRATLGIAAIGDERLAVQQVFHGVTAWLRMAPFASLIRIEEEYL